MFQIRSFPILYLQNVRLGTRFEERPTAFRVMCKCVGKWESQGNDRPSIRATAEALLMTDNILEITRLAKLRET
jgi:hypothetical protein